MARYIDKDKAISFPYANGQYDKENANENFIFGCETYKEWLETLPEEDVAPVKHGKWIDTEAYTNHYVHIYECSNCHNEVADDFIVKHTYCLHCGAKMDKEKGSI